MTFVHVDIHHITHTCPANPELHPFDTRRTIVATVDGGPCRNPISIRCGDKTAVIDCGRHEPHHRQCPACRITVIERHITSTFVGHHGPQLATTRIAA
ncbi:hypothetical protein ACWT_6175 [Actinoplanes sp. SE50]|uniref:hypothetical protein n=1 Tax=unclassified Actinoplanes TaxID=2626549 RepID=UPI00023ECD74|nr:MULTISPECIES: hypothetical protein [unclassified Actinoplanes]AEV87189.1 hypothetical protein ACPL_6307 [Actinoplanes sp. SE50/110]ATO85590.1 hypothetical protein ACWT_6175 [Actinoplanes sp. SE50]SLM03003.1 hypothetical protein ACSP50_6288 [Actinoplanes sp. SE50/110]